MICVNALREARPVRCRGRDFYWRYLARNPECSGADVFTCTCWIAFWEASQLTAERSQIGSSWIGQQIREQRNLAGLNQRELADAAGVSVGALRDLEQGRTLWPRWETVQALTSALALDVDQPEKLMTSHHGPNPRRLAARKTASPAGSANAAIHLNVLGPLVVTGSGSPIHLGPARQRAVLALLVLHGGNGTRIAELIDLLWFGRPPASAASEIHRYISRLRRLLTSACRPRGRWHPIIWTGQAYRLQLTAAVEIDSLTFREFTRRGHDALAEEEHALACQLYEIALSLWRGSALEDIDLLGEHPLVTNLNVQRSEVTIRYADAAAQIGAHHQVLPHLRDLCTRECLNEEAFTRLLVALRATGQRAAAITEFDQLRRRLDRELGIFPSQQLACVYSKIVSESASAPAR
jgi:DNA-binding SARP family transcriptional activator/transcriptional regulator with XRE-family HTH domain